MALEVWGFYDDQYAETGMAVFAQFRETYHPGNRIIVSIPEKTLTDSVGTVTIPATTIDVTAGLTYWYTDLSSSRITINFPNYSRDITSRPIDNHKYKLSAWFLFDFTFWNEGTVYHFDLLTGDIHFLSVPPSETSVEIISGGSGMSTRETIILPVFMRYDWTVTFNANGGTTPTATKDVMRGTAYGDLPTPTRPGATFDGWFTAATGGTQVTSSMTFALASDQMLYAHWTLQQYLVILDANGGIITGSPFVRTYYGEPYGALPTPTRTGYAFAGWFTAATGGTQVTSSTVCTTAANHTLYAHWTAGAVYHTVTFNATGGTVSEATRNVLEGAALGTLPTPTRTGYNFVGWYTSQVGGTLVTAATVMGDEDMEVCAVWSATSVTITFNANGGTVSETTRTVAYGAQIGRLPVPVRVGYNFNGWFTAETGGTEVTAATVCTASQTLFAHWTNGRIDWWSVTFG